MAQVSTQGQRLYVDIQSGGAFALNETAGASDIAGGDAAKFSGFVANNVVPLATSANKTGNREPSLGVTTRRKGGWSFDADFEMSGAAGTAPDLVKLLQSQFGDAALVVPTGTATVTSSGDSGGKVEITTSSAHGYSDGDFVLIAGHSVTEINRLWKISAATGSVFEIDLDYGGTAGSGGTANITGVNIVDDQDDSIVPLELWHFVDPATAEQKVAVGAIPSEVQLSFGEDFLRLSASGESAWVLTSDGFAAASTQERAGLTAFPTEPATPTYNGQAVQGFNGKCFIDGADLGSVKSVEVTFNPGRDYPEDGWNNNLPNRVRADRDLTSISIRASKTDDAVIAAMQAAAKAKTPVTLFVTMGDAAGLSMGLSILNLQLEPGNDEDNDPDVDITWTAQGGYPTTRQVVFA